MSRRPTEHPPRPTLPDRRRPASRSAATRRGPRSAARDGRLGRVVPTARVLRRRVRAWLPRRIAARRRLTAPLLRQPRSGLPRIRLAEAIRWLRPPADWRAPVRAAVRNGGSAARAWRPPRLLRRFPVHLPRRLPVPASTVTRGLFGVVAVAAGLVVIWGLSRSALLDVDHIEVRGAVEVPPAEVRAVVGVERGEPLFGVDTRAARERLEALPWVRTADVVREFPNRLSVRLTERTPVAVAPRGGGGFVLVDPTGRVLAERPDRPGGLPEIAGAGEPPAPAGWLRAARPALRAVMALPETLRSQVEIASVDRGSVALRVGGREVRFGPAELLGEKASALVALLEHLGDRPVAYLDVRVPSAPVVAPAGRSGAAETAATAPSQPRD